MLRDRCLICDSTRLHEIIDLGMHPFADSFIPEDRVAEPDLVYPLVCDLCPSCGQSQTRCVTEPKDRYRRVDYSYTSSNSAFSRTHWERYAKEVDASAALESGSPIVEIGSNDGYLCQQFARLGHRVLGVDASPAMAALARTRGVETLCALFDRGCAEEIRRDFGKAKLVVANNVFNHSNDPLSFAEGAATLLDEDGRFVFELPYWYDSIKTGRFDQIYHEHVSYFSARSSMSLLERAGLSAAAVEIVDYHGGSLRVTAQRREGRKNHCPEILQLAEKEEVEGMFSPASYARLVACISEQRNRLLKDLLDLKSRGLPIVGVGAAAKSNTFLNFCRLDRTLIDFVTDASPHKQGKLTPLSRIPICGDDVFRSYGDVCALILSWNIGQQLKDILLGLNPRVRFIEPGGYRTL